MRRRPGIPFFLFFTDFRERRREFFGKKHSSSRNPYAIRLMTSMVLVIFSVGSGVLPPPAGAAKKPRGSSATSFPTGGICFCHGGLSRKDRLGRERWLFTSANGVLCASTAYGMDVGKEKIGA